MQEEDEEEDEDGVVVARTYMDARQYTRAVHALRQCVGPKAIFMRVYCQFIVCSLLCMPGHTLTRHPEGQRTQSIARVAQARQYVLHF